MTVIAGPHDKAAPPVALEALQQGLPNARLEVVDGPHIAYLEVPETFANAVAGHLEWVRGTS